MKTKMDETDENLNFRGTVGKNPPEWVRWAVQIL
jgi:hypothetical protein